VKSVPGRGSRRWLSERAGQAEAKSFFAMSVTPFWNIASAAAPLD
jgi:hypothetical protein